MTFSSANTFHKLDCNICNVCPSEQHIEESSDVTPESAGRLHSPEPFKSVTSLLIDKSVLFTDTTMLKVKDLG